MVHPRRANAGNTAIKVWGELRIEATLTPAGVAGLIGNAGNTVAAIIRSSVPGVPSISANQLELLGRAFTPRLEQGEP